VKIYHSIEEFPTDVKTVVTTGTFDGVHKGHRVVINRINDIAHKNGLQSLVFTLNPHPRHVLYPEDQQLKLINSIDEKIQALKTTGLQNLVVYEFTKKFSRTNSVHFVRDILVNKLNMKHMVVGFDHHFGRNRQGTFDNLVELSHFYDFQLEQIQPQNIKKITISSTKIRKAIIDGDIMKANQYLSSNFSLFGKVIRGNGIGRKIDFPTANIKLNYKWKILPKNGVYAVIVNIGKEKKIGMLNIGVRPSISDNIFSIEVNIFDFKDNIYDREINVEFIKRIRDEKKFINLESLKNQLIIDEIHCRNFFAI
tara:strand:- start:3 stop:932 length:930 start_codon:yes stop_codon:yes gene_type:complete